MQLWLVFHNSRSTRLADPPSLLKVNKAIQQMASGKASGVDSLPAEVLKAGSPQLATKLSKLFLSM